MNNLATDKSQIFYAKPRMMLMCSRVSTRMESDFSYKTPSKSQHSRKQQICGTTLIGKTLLTAGTRLNPDGRPERRLIQAKVQLKQAILRRSSLRNRKPTANLSSLSRTKQTSGMTLPGKVLLTTGTRRRPAGKTALLLKTIRTWPKLIGKSTRISSRKNWLKQKPQRTQLTASSCWLKPTRLTFGTTQHGKQRSTIGTKLKQGKRLELRFTTKAKILVATRQLKLSVVRVKITHKIVPEAQGVILK